jgi:hypothetical protein
MVKGKGTLEHAEIPLRMREAAGLMVLGCALWDGMEPFLDQVDEVRKIGQESIPYSDQLKLIRRIGHGRFDRFVEEYNHERPHEALALATPASLYESSLRAMPNRLPEVVYPFHWPTRKVQRRGEIHWGGGRVFLSETLSGQRVGFEPIDDGHWRVWFASTPLALFDERRVVIVPLAKDNRRQPMGRSAPKTTNRNEESIRKG